MIIPTRSNDFLESYNKKSTNNYPLISKKYTLMKITNKNNNKRKNRN